ncbi:MAG TPA: DUF3011 domain-containing protein [Bryobacteraceae bacterium]|nr:DUF3011 domain-containing protein [Bryobacteraceae bacterium]
MTHRLLRVIAPAFLSCALFGQGGFAGPGRYEIMNLKSGKVLDLDRNDQTTVIQFSPRGSENQSWDIRPAGGGAFYLRNGMNGFALDAGGGGRSEPVRGVPFNGGPSQRWRLESGKDGNALIVSQFGRTLDVPDGSPRDGLQIQLYDLNGDSNQRFILRRLGGGRDWDERRDDRDPGRADRPTQGGLVCSSNNGERVYCAVDTRGGVQLVRQISGSPCDQGRTWGWDNRGVWVDRGCRAEFVVSRPPRQEYRGQQITCSSNHGERVYCDVDTRGMVVRLTRQISGSPCDNGRTWGWDRRGIWVDRGCRAEFAVVPDR